MLLTLILSLALLFAPVFSPQYLLWIVPILLSYALEYVLGVRPKSTFFFRIIFTAAVITMATDWIIFNHYWDLVYQTAGAVFALNVRNAGLLVLVILLAYDLGIFTSRSARPVPISFSSMLRDLAYDGVLLAVAAFLFFSIRPQLIPHAKSLSYSATHAAATDRDTGLPLVLGNDNQTLAVSMDYVIPVIAFQPWLRVRQDDCLESLTVNGYRVPDQLLHFCEGSGPGRVFGFKEHLHPGTNRIEAIVRNTGGPIGFGIIPPPSSLLRVITYAFLFSLCWFAFHGMQFLFAIIDPLMSFLRPLRYTLPCRWLIRRFSAGISTTSSQDRQPALFT